MHTNIYSRRRPRSSALSSRNVRVAPPALASRETQAASLPSWPALLTVEQAGAYLAMHPDTFLRHVNVPPIRLRARLLRWSRADIDRWVDEVRSRGGQPQAPERLSGTTTQALRRVLDRAKQMKAD